MAKPPSQIPVCDSTEEHNKEYQNSKTDSSPFLVIDNKSEEYAVSYDLLPTGHRLADQPHSELTSEIDSFIDETLETTNRTDELGRSIGDSKGNIHLFENKSAAAEAANIISDYIYDESNWEEEPSPASYWGR